MIKRVLFVIALALAFLAGQYSITWTHDIDILERQTLKLINDSYLIGCTDTKSKDFADCKKRAEIWKKTIDTVRNSMWKEKKQ